MSYRVIFWKIEGISRRERDGRWQHGEYMLEVCDILEQKYHCEANHLLQ